jgi:SAM-dependent methyltransferase
MMTRIPTDRFAEIAEGYDLLARTTSEDRYRDVLAAVPRDAERVLDVGCGTGVLAVRLARDARRVIGIDRSPAMLALARERQAGEGTSRVSFVAADFERPPFRDHAFDVVVSSYALYAADLPRVLSILRGLVRPGGRFAIADLVARWPRLHRTRARRVAAAFAALPGLALRHGPVSAWRVFGFRIRRAWRGPWSEGLLLTPAAFRAAYGRELPGCRIAARRERGAMTAVWDAPVQSALR